MSRVQLSDDRASFAYVRVTYRNDEESQRSKFIFMYVLRLAMYGQLHC